MLIAKSATLKTYGKACLSHDCNILVGLLVSYQAAYNCDIIPALVAGRHTGDDAEEGGDDGEAGQDCIDLNAYWTSVLISIRGDRECVHRKRVNFCGQQLEPDPSERALAWDTDGRRWIGTHQIIQIDNDKQLHRTAIQTLSFGSVLEAGSSRRKRI